MELKNRIEGIVYKTQTYKESSRLLWVFTKKGTITLNARGSERLSSSDRILAGYLNKISFITNDKDFQSLKDAKLIEDYSYIKKDFILTKRTNLMFEIINRTIIDEIYFEKIYILLDGSLKNENLLVSTLSFSLKLLYYLGYGMDFKSDGREVVGFNISLGRIVYRDESYDLDLNIEETTLLLKLTYTKINDLENINENEIKVISEFVYKYYIDKMELKLKSLE